MISDTHFTNKAQDVHRFGIFKECFDICKKQGIRTVFHLGDLTDAKDGHSSKLVNALVDGTSLFTKNDIDFFILKGNHDYVDPQTPFFEFLKHTGVTYVKDKVKLNLFGKTAELAGHTTAPDFSEHTDLRFIHQPVKGATIGKNRVLDSALGVKDINSTKIFAGDVHSPQKQGKLEYVGSPYHVSFGETHRGRGLIFCPKTLGADEVHFDHPAKVVISSTMDNLSDISKIKEGDEIRVDLSVDNSDVGNIKKRLNEIHKQLSHLIPVDIRDNVQVSSKGREEVVDNLEELMQYPTEILEKHIKANNITPELGKAGKQILKKVAGATN